MKKTIESKGQCLCGGVKIHAKKIDADLGACHCGICRKWGGGPFLAVGCGTEINLSGEENISRYPSSEWAERGFCKKCGTHLFYFLKITGEYILSAGLFEAQEEFFFGHQIFIDKKPAYYNFAEETKKMTEAEVFAKYGG